MSGAAQLAVVLVEPSGPLNVGSVARLCANFDVGELRLVAPRCDHLGEEARRMAVHGGWLLEQARLFPSLSAALADCCRVVATSGRRSGEPLPLQAPEPALRWLAQARGPCALVFGREDRGLSNDELLQAGKILRLESSADYASLNLSHAVAICLHELRRIPAPTAPPEVPLGGQGPGQANRLAQSGAMPGGGSGGEAGPGAAAPLAASPGEGATSLRGALEATLADAQNLLLEVGFLHPHTAHARMAKLRGLLQRAQIREGEVALIRGMVRQLRWATTRRTP